MKTLNFKLTSIPSLKALAIVLAFGSSFGINTASAGTVNGLQAIQMVRSVLQKDVLFGKTLANEPCVVEQILPNRVRPELQIRVYLGQDVDDVPSSAAWIRIDPRRTTVDLKKSQNLMILKNLEQVTGNASTSRIQSTMGLQENFQVRILTVRIQTVSVVTAGASLLPARMADLTCLVSFDQREK